MVLAALTAGGLVTNCIPGMKRYSLLGTKQFVFCIIAAPLEKPNGWDQLFSGVGAYRAGTKRFCTPALSLDSPFVSFLSRAAPVVGFALRWRQSSWWRCQFLSWHSRLVTISALLMRQVAKGTQRCKGSLFSNSASKAIRKMV